jgi:hypothetical protein
MIPRPTITGWWQDRDQIFVFAAGTRMIRKTWISCWPEMETELFRLFCQRREKGYVVRRFWFRKWAHKLYHQNYVEELVAAGKQKEADNIAALFVFSSGWFDGFCRRNRIVLRRVTKVVKVKICKNYYG